VVVRKRKKKEKGHLVFSFLVSWEIYGEAEKVKMKGPHKAKK